MAVNDPQAIKFSDEVVRPLSELLRDLSYAIKDYDTRWNLEVGTMFTSAGSEAVEDGRELEGISRLTAADVSNFWTQVQNIRNLFAVVGVMDVITKPNVRRTTLPNLEV